MIALVILLGGAAGAALRGRVAHAWNGDLPNGTLAVNLAASFVLGVVSQFNGWGDTVVQVGFLGALSTWSALALEILTLIRSQRLFLAAGYFTASVIGGVTLAWLGLQTTGW